MPNSMLQETLSAVHYHHHHDDERHHHGVFLVQSQTERQ